MNSLKVSFTYAYFELDPVGFIEQLCENKDQPELECNGKCQLKKVAENSSTDNNNLPNIIDFKEILLYKVSVISYKFISINSKKDSFNSYTNLYSYLSFSECFHPPKALSTNKA